MLQEAQQDLALPVQSICSFFVRLFVCSFLPSFLLRELLCGRQGPHPQEAYMQGRQGGPGTMQCASYRGPGRGQKEDPHSSGRHTQIEK